MKTLTINRNDTGFLVLLVLKCLAAGLLEVWILLMLTGCAGNLEAPHEFGNHSLKEAQASAEAISRLQADEQNNETNK